ncbi:MAG: hypothetical protein CSA79_02765 [Thiothrix nivea]|nr:MAG: hypothetical protein CSA79_02765 [Thiothrix nivea]
MTPNLTHWVVALLLCLSFSAQAEIYKWTDSDGNTHYSQTPPQDNKSKAEDIGEEIDMAAGTASDTNNKAVKQEKTADNEMEAARKQGKENTLKHRTFCEQQKAALKKLLSNPVIRWKSKDEEKILSADERKNKIAEFEKNIKELCNPDVLSKQQEISAE